MAVAVHLKKQPGTCEPGDVLLLGQRGRFLHLAKPADPFEVLAKDAVRQYRRGETISLRELAEAGGIDLNKGR